MVPETLTAPAAAPPRQTARVLPPEEWDRLPLDVSSALVPGSSIVVVREDETGQIVARWCAILTVHLEGLYIAPSHRGRAGVAGPLLREMFRALQEAGVVEVLTTVQDPIVAGMADAAGFEALPGAIYRRAIPPLQGEG